MSSKRIALLAVGSFNPPTIAHLRMLEVAKSHIESENNCVVEGIMSPVADTYNNKSTLIASSHRFQMVTEATKSSDWIRGDDWECTQKTWSRTLGVLNHHKKQLELKHGDSIRLMLVVGGDVVDSFTKVLPDGSTLWNPSDIIEIINNYGLIVIARENSNPIQTIKSMPVIQDFASNVVVIRDEVCPCSVSSTRLRKAISENRSIKYSTPDEVIAYIARNNLYKN